MLRIWGRANSLNVQKALLSIEMVGLPYERTDAGMEFGINDTAAYHAMNPNGLVPTIDDDGFILWESNSIVRYIASRHSVGHLWPVDPQERALCERWMDWQLATLNASINPGFVQLVRTPRETRDMTVVERSRQASERAMEILDAHLTTRKWLELDRFTIAECSIAPFVHRWLNMPLERQSRPALERWYEAVMSLPAVRRVQILPLT